MQATLLTLVAVPFVRGDLDTSTAGWGLFWAVVLVLAGVLVGTRTFRRESA